MKHKKKNQESLPVPTQQNLPTPEPSTPAAVENRLEKSLDACISRLASDPLESLSRKQIHVGLEAVVLRADRVAAENDWMLESANVDLQYRDKNGNRIAICTNLDMVEMKRSCRLLYGPVSKEKAIETKKEKK